MPVFRLHLACKNLTDLIGMGIICSKIDDVQQWGNFVRTTFTTFLMTLANFPKLRQQS
jgi:hypothetical protein